MVTIMRESTVKILDDKDMEFVETLRSLDVPRNVATLITFLANVRRGLIPRDRNGIRPRQPEVSIAMRTLATISGSKRKRSSAKARGDR